MTVHAASTDVNEEKKPSVPIIAKCPASTDTFAEKSVGVVRLVYGDDAFLVPYADGAVTTMRELLVEVFRKVGVEMNPAIAVVYGKDGNACDVNRSVKEIIDGCGGSISFILSK